MKPWLVKLLSTFTLAAIAGVILILPTPPQAQTSARAPDIGSIPRSEGAPASSPRSPGAGGGSGSGQSPGGSQGETPYGGLNIFTLTCTCSGNTLLFLMDYRTSRLLRLLYQPGASRLYSYFNVYGRYLLGSYQPSQNQCRIQAGNTCVTISADGQLGTRPGSGTSL